MNPKPTVWKEDCSLIFMENGSESKKTVDHGIQN